MRKLFALSLVLIMVLSLVVSCGENQAEDKNEQKTQEHEETTPNNDDGVVVEENFSSIDLTIPSTIIGDLSEFNEEEYLANNEGIKSAKVNEDGSLTIRMTKSKHEALMREMKQEIDSTFQQLIEAEDTPYIKDIEYTNGFKEVKIKVEKEAYENAFDLTPFIAGISVGMYQVYSGEEFKTTVIVEDAETGEEISSVVYPDELEKMR